MVIIGVDTGGTFTDFVFYEHQTLKTLKLPSTPKNPEETIIKGIQPYLNRDFILLHGTTVATNAFLENKMAKTAFLTTKGFEHILHIGRQNRINVFSLDVFKPSPIIPLNLCLGITERTLSTGTITKGIKIKELKNLETFLNKTKIQSIAIVFLHSYKNAKNEEIVLNFFKKNGYYVSASFKIMPEYKEYERSVITVLNAALMPVIQKYISKLNKSLNNNKLYIMQSNGGLLSPLQIMTEPVRTLLSGPSGGVIAAQKIARNIKIKNLITLDMGGTSTDISVIKSDKISLSRETKLANLPIGLPMIDIETTGAGGGSIARVDKAGALRVGPKSAGADPGPACYGKSLLPTVTDAFTVIGALHPDYFLGGKMKIYPQRSKESINKLAKKLNKDLYHTAQGIIQISISNIERALRSITIEKGEDPRHFSLMPFGGAGGLVICQLADRLGITKIIAPDYQGVFSGFGMLFADYKKELNFSILKPYSQKTRFFIQERFFCLAKEALEILRKEGFTEEQITLEKYLEIRYKGQSYELSIPYKRDFINIFHKKHQHLYSYQLKDKDCEIVNIRLIAIGKILREKIKYIKENPVKTSSSFKKDIFYNDSFLTFHFVKRNSLKKNQIIKRPSIITSSYSTLIIDPSFEAKVDNSFNILLEKKNHG